jgi:tRNA uridine 5-carboxymethylaminomethyl modification enzyme
VSEERWRLLERKREAVDEELAALQASWVRPGSAAAAQLAAALGGDLGREQRALELLRRPGVAYAELVDALGAEPRRWQQDERLSSQVPLQVEVQAKYAGYIERQQQEIERQRRNEDARLPEDLDYLAVPGLSNEVRQRLAEQRPATVGQAARIPGVTPAAISLLLVHLKRREAGAVIDRTAASGG